MKSCLYLPDQGAFDAFDDVTDEDEAITVGDSLVEYKDDNRFHIGAAWLDAQPARSLVCTRRQGDKFYVGQGTVYTAIKCVNCEWEFSIHEG